MMNGTHSGSMRGIQKFDIGIIGMGPMGATYAAARLESGRRVAAFDLDKNRTQQLKYGDPGFYELGVSEVLSKHITAGEFYVAERFCDLVFCSDMIVISHIPHNSVYILF